MGFETALRAQPSHARAFDHAPMELDMELDRIDKPWDYLNRSPGTNMYTTYGVRVRRTFRLAHSLKVDVVEAAGFRNSLMTDV